MTQTSALTKLGLLDVLPRIAALLPRIPAIAMHLKAGLSIKAEDTASLGKVLEENAIKYKDRLAWLYEDQRFTHHTFNEKVNQYAQYFLSVGVQKDDVVVVFMENSIETVFLIAALAKIGGIASLVHPQQRLSALVHSIQLSHGAYFVIGAALISAFEEVRPALNLSADSQYFWVETKGDKNCPSAYIDLNASVAGASKKNPAATATIKASQQYANVFTSGTTGLPQASIQRHKRWLTTYYWFGKVNLNLSAEDVMYVPIPFYHTNALIVAWPSAAAAGAAIAMRSRFSTSHFWKDVEKFSVTCFIYIGELCRYLYNAPHSVLERQHRIKKIIGNGLRPDIWKDFKKRFNIPQVFELYGSADGNIGFTNTLNIDCCVGWSPNAYAIVKYDVEQQVPVRNSQGHMEKVSKGEAGLLIAKINEKVPFDGYVDECRNQEKLLHDVFIQGDQWFNTGDLLRDIGYKHAQFVDRVGDTFRWKGENVSTDEIEKLVNAEEAVQACAVYGVKIPHTDGRAGMLAIRIDLSCFELRKLTEKLIAELPSHALPVFIRICEGIETTATLKIKKYPLQAQGFNCEDTVYVKLPKVADYTVLSSEIKAGITQNEYAF